jgi:hypothetical protein
MRLLSLSVYRASIVALLGRANEGQPVTELSLVELERAGVSDLLGSAPQAELFPAWLDAGYRGLALMRDGTWVSYGWLATPSSPPAVHLPSWTAGRFWIFNCRTRTELRGQGNYQRMLVELVRLAGRLGSQEGDEIFVDSLSSNAASVRAIERVGFAAAGKILQLEVSRLGLRPSIAIGVPRGRPEAPR